MGMSSRASLFQDVLGLDTRKHLRATKANLAICLLAPNWELVSAVPDTCSSGSSQLLRFSLAAWSIPVLLEDAPVSNRSGAEACVGLGARLLDRCQRKGGLWALRRKGAWWLFAREWTSSGLLSLTVSDRKENAGAEA